MEQRMQSMGPVLVTGAGGFIGRHLLRRLLEEQVEAVAFDLPQVPIPNEFKARVQWLAGDLRNLTDIQRALTGINTVFHLAAMVGDWGQEDLHRQVTVEGSNHLFAVAAKEGIRTILASSIVVYGDRLGRQTCTEETPFGRAMGPYSRSKQAQEALAWDYYRKQGLRLSVVRPANVFGAGCKPWVDDALHELRRGLPSLIGGGDFDAGLVYVENLVDLMLRVASHERTIGRVYNGCDDFGVTWRDYFSELAQIAGLAQPKAMPRWLATPMAHGMENLWRWFNVTQRPPLTREALNIVGSHHRISMERARKELAYEPKVAYGVAMQVVRRHVLGMA